MTDPEVNFTPGMDPFSWDIHVDGTEIGRLQSHGERPARLVLSAGEDPLVEIPLTVLKIIVDRAPEVTGLVKLYEQPRGAVLPNPAHHVTRSTYLDR